jgi:cytochrome bd-type quinol oxidase subunit 2
VSIWATLLCAVLVGAPLMVMTASRARSWGWILGVATFAGLASVTFVVQAQVYLDNHEYFLDVSGRYALGFLPWAIICLAVVAGRRRLLRSSFAFISLGLLVMLLAETQLLTLGPALVGNSKYLVG